MIMNKGFWILFIVILIHVLMVVVIHARMRGDEPLAPQQHKSVELVQSADVVMPATGRSWLELPSDHYAEAEHCFTHYAQMQGRPQRNYTFLYDEDTYTSCWVAYPLCAAHTTQGREEVWGFDPKINTKHQTSVAKGYGASRPTENYPKNFYARGHQLPNADRNGVPQMQAQTYYSTNMTPQLQYGFNGGIWAKLEAAVRSAVPQDDTLYVVTGAAFRKFNENLAAARIVNKNDGKSLPVPNYYWKAVLKVKRSGGQIKDAMAIGFWLPHKDLKGHSYADYAVSVEQIQQWTGFDFFVNLPDEKEKPAETNQSWQAFLYF